jgi:GTP-binding protein
MFIDKAKIFITAGAGGDGCISFRREKYVPLGGPDGGNGGKGGDIFFEADPHLTTLLDLTYKSHYKAKSGMPGSASNCAGRGAEDFVIRVPLGTVIYKNGEAVADMKEAWQKLLMARGGRGGRGNSSFKTNRHTAPRIKERGEPGEEFTLELELKLIADVGLVGFPNAGKSTFLSRVSAAKPKIADYPFTTLAPNLGVVRSDYGNFVVADIPGLIEGAHNGKGIGDEFLRHIQRTRVLIHIVDVNGYNENTAYKNFRIINKELAEFSESMLKKPMLIAANKMDLSDSDKKLAQLKKSLKNKKIYPISAVTGEGMKELLNAVIKTLQKAPAAEDIIAEPVKQYIYEAEFTVKKEGNAFVVKGAKIEKLSAMTDFTSDEGLRRFQGILKKKGVEKALEDKGIIAGDTVRIGGFEFDFEK